MASPPPWAALRNGGVVRGWASSISGQVQVRGAEPAISQPRQAPIGRWGRWGRAGNPGASILVPSNGQHPWGLVVAGNAARPRCYSPGRPAPGPRLHEHDLGLGARHRRGHDRHAVFLEGVTGAGSGRAQRVIPPRADRTVVACPILGYAVGFADGRIQVDGQRRVAGSCPVVPCACQQLAAHAVELTEVAPAKAAQEGAQGGWRLDDAAENTDRPTGAQRIGVVDAVAARQHGSDQRQHLVPRVRPPRHAAEVEMMVDDFPQAQVLVKGDRQERASIGQQAVVITGDADTVGLVLW